MESSSPSGIFINSSSIYGQCLVNSSASGITYGNNNDGINGSTLDILLCVSNALEAQVQQLQAQSQQIIIAWSDANSSNFNNNSNVTINENTTADIEDDNYNINNENLQSGTRDLILVLAAALIFFMQAGFAMVCAGAVRKKNVQNTMLKNLLDACGAGIAFFCVGYAFAFGGADRDDPNKTFVGTSNFFLMNVQDYAFWLFEYAFSAASATIVAGALAERCQMAAYLCYSIMLTGWVYPIIAHSIWCPQGFLSAYSIDPLWGTGVLDFSGSGVVHVTGGTTALFAAWILGPRRGRFHDEDGHELDQPNAFQGSSVALQMLGTFILWFGWYGFNGGNALLVGLTSETSQQAALAAVNTTLSAGTAGLLGLLSNLWWLDRTTGESIFDLKYAMNGALSGLVAITGGCALVEPWAAVATGFFAGINYTITSRLLVWFHIDDAVDAVPVHLCNGILGLITTGLFASPSRILSVYGRNKHVGLFYSWSQGNSDFVLLGTQLVGLLFIIGWVMFIMVPFFIWLDFMGWFRADALEEIVGLDTSYHGGLALLGNSDNEGISEEHISEFKKRRTESINLRHRVMQIIDEGTPKALQKTRSSHGIDGEGSSDVLEEEIEEGVQQ